VGCVETLTADGDDESFVAEICGALNNLAGASESAGGLGEAIRLTS
jgi:hypothetical protein